MMAKEYKIATIPGDGIGKEVLPEGLKVLQAVAESGGKFELRKGQDLVLRAVKILQEKYQDIILINCWYNKWPASTQLMGYSRFIRFEYQNKPWRELMNRTYVINGLDPNRIHTCDLVSNEKQREKDGYKILCICET